MKKETLVSGITATGKLTLGNYIGALKNFIKLQDKYEMFIFVADLHALTTEITPEELSENRKSILALYLAAGLDPKKATIFYQSSVSAHAEASFIMENRTTLGELQRMTQFKDKSQSNGSKKIKTGLLTYPALMAGDILIYNANVVPTGADQKQHIELTRNIAERFNNQYGETFNIPQPLIPEIGARIMSLSDPTKKMSKSSTIEKSYISLLEDPAKEAKKIKKAVTDSENKVYFSKDKPGVSNLLTIYASLKEITIKEAEAEFKDSENYGELKVATATIVEKFLTDLQAKYKDALKMVDKVATDGAIKANKVSQEKLKEIHSKIGL
ncbi:MAG: tryptophan--tRNA ligase [Mycoplasmataceae bacterium]|nr:tryptophan--tRNA ligase [Mycoplasmataceae bacterium]